MNKLYIPNKIKVGYQERQDTYTGKLAYVIYYDNKGVLRKEKSWTTWCDLPESPQYVYNSETQTREAGTGIAPNDFDNVPTSGFILNKKVGGYKSDWNFRSAYCRVYDPRGFEFEITVENLLFILECCSSFKGKGLEGEFVYSWSGTELVLLPVNSETYKQSTKHTDLQNADFSARSLKLGNIYVTKDGENITYIGRFNYLKVETNYYGYDNNKNNYTYKVSKQHIFKADKEFKYYSNIQKSISGDSGKVDQNLAHLIDEYLDSINGTEIVSIVLEKIDNWTHNNSWFNFYTDYQNNKATKMSIRKWSEKFHISEKSTLVIDGNNYKILNNNRSYHWSYDGPEISLEQIMAMDKYKLFLVGKNGKKYEQS